MTKKVYQQNVLSVITKNLNWDILTKNLVTFNRWDGVKDEKYFNIIWVHWKIFFRHSLGFPLILLGKYLGWNQLMNKKSLFWLPPHSLGFPLSSIVSLFFQNFTPSIYRTFPDRKCDVYDICRHHSKKSMVFQAWIQSKSTIQVVILWNFTKQYRFSTDLIHRK